MATLVEIVSVVVNVAGSFMTDGNWKTAGTGLAQFYWNRSRSYSNLEAGLPRREGSSWRFAWTAASLTR